ncbi:MAG: hypothetical protein HYY84_20670 [Deltaproteobacteria bacterium]|nr:hypothetical protein [Deltaproteobacteria bacterium]
MSLRVAYLLLLAVAASAGCGCGSGSGGEDGGASPTADGGSTLFVPCPGAVEPGPTNLVGADVTRQGYVGTIDVTVAFCNPLIPQPPNELLFFVTLTDHSGIAPSNVANGTSVTIGAGLGTNGPITWDGDDLTLGDHHVMGHLHAPNHAADGTPLLGPATTYLELTLGGIGGDGKIVVRWEQEYLPK